MHAFRKAIDGRSVALIGNARSIFDRQQGPQIDQNDVVIRMNAGFIKEPLCQGSRTDVWVSSLAVPVENVIAEFDPCVVVWATSKRREIPADYGVQEFPFEKHPLLEWARLRWTLGARPSTGLIIANYIYRRCTPSVVNVFGFDHFKSGTFYNETENLGPHKPDPEHNMFLDFYDSGRFLKNGAKG